MLRFRCTSELPEGPERRELAHAQTSSLWQLIILVFHEVRDEKRCAVLEPVRVFCRPIMTRDVSFFGLFRGLAFNVR